MLPECYEDFHSVSLKGLDVCIHHFLNCLSLSRKGGSPRGLFSISVSERIGYFDCQSQRPTHGTYFDVLDIEKTSTFRSTVILCLPKCLCSIKTLKVVRLLEMIS